MPLRLRLLPFLGFVLAALTIQAMPAAAQQILVLVNGQPITTYDVAQRQKLFQIIGEKPPGAKDTLEELIDQHLKVATAARAGMSMDDEDVDKMFASVASRSGRTAEQLAALLRQQGVEPSTFKNKLKADSIWQNYVRARAPAINVRDTDVLAALAAKNGATTQMTATEYKLYPIIFVVPRGSNAYQARLSEANALRGRFTNCEAGIDQAKAMREVVVRSPVYRMSSDMPAAQRQILEKTDIGRLTPPEVTQSGVEIFAVCAKTPVKGESAQKREVKDELASTQFQAESKKLLAGIRKQALIVYR